MWLFASQIGVWRYDPYSNTKVIVRHNAVEAVDPLGETLAVEEVVAASPVLPKSVIAQKKKGNNPSRGKARKASKEDEEDELLNSLVLQNQQGRALAVSAKNHSFTEGLQEAIQNEKTTQAFWEKKLARFRPEQRADVCKELYIHLLFYSRPKNVSRFLIQFACQCDHQELPLMLLIADGYWVQSFEAIKAYFKTHPQSDSQYWDSQYIFFGWILANVTEIHVSKISGEEKMEGYNQFKGLSTAKHEIRKAILNFLNPDMLVNFSGKLLRLKGEYVVRELPREEELRDLSELDQKEIQKIKQHRLAQDLKDSQLIYKALFYEFQQLGLKISYEDFRELLLKIKFFR